MFPVGGEEIGLSILARSFHRLLGTELFQIVKRHDFGTDETALKIGVNRARGLRRFVSFTNAPSLDLVWSRGEEVNQVHGGESRRDNLRQHRLHALVLAPLRLVLFRDVLKLALDFGGKRNYGAATVRLHPLVNLDQEFILFAFEIFTAQVDQVNHRFGRQQLILVQVHHIIRRPLLHAVTNLLPALEPIDDLTNRLQLLLLLLGRHRVRRARDLLLRFFLQRAHEFQILRPQLRCDDFDIIHRIDAILDVYDIRVLEASHHVRDAVDGFNVRQKRVSESSARGRPFHQPRDIDNL